jgi:hypothetical protein
VSEGSTAAIILVVVCALLLMGEGLIGTIVYGNALTSTTTTFTPPGPPTVTGSWWDTVNNVGYLFSYVFSILAFVIAWLGAAVTGVGLVATSSWVAIGFNAVVLMLMAGGIIKVILP